MKLEKLEERVEIPQGVKCDSLDNGLSISGEKGNVTRSFRDPKITMDVSEGSVSFYALKATKREKAKIKTFRAHVRNMIKGVQEGFVYKLKICTGHFPMNVSVSGDKLIVKNFLGEKVPRELHIKEGAKVKVDGIDVTVESVNKETAGQVAADIEQLCRITNRDRRIFQDGIYIVEKAGANK